MCELSNDIKQNVNGLNIQGENGRLKNVIFLEHFLNKDISVLLDIDISNFKHIVIRYRWREAHLTILI